MEQNVGHSEQNMNIEYLWYSRNGMVEETRWSKQKTDKEERRHQTGFESDGDTGGRKDTETQTAVIQACGVDG